jgi:hypothetical protein
MDKTPESATAAIRDAAPALRQAAADGEYGHDPFARTRFRVMAARRTQPGKWPDQALEGEP